jgi:hypothetical protein
VSEPNSDVKKEYIADLAFFKVAPEEHEEDCAVGGEDLVDEKVDSKLTFLKTGIGAQQKSSQISQAKQATS